MRPRKFGKSLFSTTLSRYYGARRYSPLFTSVNISV
ncbi:MAG: AAA family ATPase [Treponema sp.]|nr:AAA family ATPase [Treponema sp.]